ncbi:monocarboxylate permease, putative [Talaromyces marneffei ATCC 18224]|uniref:Monocarboxylate permease, putative n=1 Tax=Talaromyces marneffei (strain ATCC 18224 / CBS 334.59 / QM 7333) TaxID=441960 RepID=B6QM31_TALMQ|nr:monocarboxylate permease, putative [Talaromyces marneffei ATCC 18224]
MTAPTLTLHEQMSIPEPGENELATQIAQCPSNPPVYDAQTFPDGGLKAWLNVVGGWCIFFSLFGWVNGVCTCIGDAALFTASLSTCSTWFYRRRAFAFGVLLTGTSIGGVVMPIILEHLLGRLDFGWAIRICTFINLVLLVIALPTVTSRLPPHPKPVSLWYYLRPLKGIRFLMLSAGCALFYLGMYLPFNFIIVQALYEGMSPALAGYLIPILNATSLFGRIIPGIAADMVGRFNTMVAMCAFAGIIVLALWLPGRANAPIILFSGLYGFASGAFISLIPALTAQISDIREIGVRSGTLWLTVAIAALVASPIGGAMEVRDDGAFEQLQIFAGVVMLVGTSCFGVARWYLSGGNLVAKVCPFNINIPKVSTQEISNLLCTAILPSVDLDLVDATKELQTKIVRTTDHKAGRFVKLLLDRGADVNFQGGYFGNALQVASFKGHKEIMKLLLDNGAGINIQGGHFVNALKAASAGNQEGIKGLLLEKGMGMSML